MNTNAFHDDCEDYRRKNLPLVLRRNLAANRARLMQAHNQLAEAVNAAIPLLKFFENRLASSLSFDSRSHDNDREPRRQMNAILDAAAHLQSVREQ